MDSDPFSTNASSQLSSGFKSAISTSPSEHRLHHKSHLARAHSACLPSNKRPRQSDVNQAPQLNDVFPVWLEASQQERYLLLEDGDTGDMLMPLIYMKSVFEANYSRKLSSLKNRLVVIPSDQEPACARPNTYLYWQWAFESPPNVKLLVRQELGEENAPQGHLRLILLPIVYNAMAAKESLWKLPLFIALQQAMRASTYNKLLRHPSAGPITPKQNGQQTSEASKNSEGQAAGSRAGSMEGSPDLSQAERVFHGPRDLDATAMKYMRPFKDVEETDGGAKLSGLHRATSHHNLGQTAGKVSVMMPHMGHPELTELHEDLQGFKRQSEAQIESLSSELAIVKNCIMQLYNVLLPGKLPVQHLQAAPPAKQEQAPPAQQLPQHQQQPLPPSQLQHASRAHHATAQRPTYNHLSAGHVQSSQGLQNAPERAFLPAQAMMPGQMHSNCSMASLVSGSAAAQEGSHSSSTIGIPAHSMGALAQQAPLQLGPDGASLAAMQGLQPYLQASGAQDLPTLASIHHHPSFQGALGVGRNALGLHMQQLSTSQQLPPAMPPQGALDNLAGGHFASHDGLLPPQLADLNSASMQMPQMP